ncbi:transporter family-2 protein [Clostridium collagenovorans DSM 3089]|uniref:Transporter family-2 protein n=1 Tax=Clostridium collagenovorans DSM 3089 TaxID=1121306 RepID=A0A1M5Y2V7_9CLOT|nr:DMT family transporter [Clostridium collagenovorans]SHI06134.1 transporter family-2 protein [Clostridium collagenovorans DSM 3089]
MNSILALIIGALISIMITFNGMLESNIGAINSLIIIHIMGLITISLLMLIKRQKVKLDKNIPLYLFSGGAVGVALTLVNLMTIGKIGVSLTTSLAVFGQLIFSSLIDHYGFFGMKKYKFNPKKIIGFIIIAIGLVVMTVV